MIRRPPRSTPLYSSAASDVYKRQPKPYREPPRKSLAHKTITSEAQFQVDGLGGLEVVCAEEPNQVGIVPAHQGGHASHAESLQVINKFLDQLLTDALMLTVRINADGIQRSLLLRDPVLSYEEFTHNEAYHVPLFILRHQRDRHVVPGCKELLKLGFVVLRPGQIEHFLIDRRHGVKIAFLHDSDLDGAPDHHDSFAPALTMVLSSSGMGSGTGMPDSFSMAPKRGGQAS